MLFIIPSAGEKAALLVSRWAKGFPCEGRLVTS